MRYTCDIVIPTFNNLKELIQTLKGFEEQSFKDFRILVCVDGSNDGTIEFLAESKFNFDIKVISHPLNKNKGRSATRNLSINQLDSKFIIFLDSDIVPDIKFIEEHLTILEQGKVSLGEVKYININTNLLARYFMNRGKSKFNHLDEIIPYYLTSGNFAMNTSDFIALKGFDENIVAYGTEDADLGCRIKRILNKNLYYNIKAIGYSVFNKEINLLLNQMEELASENLEYFIKNNPEAIKYIRTDLFTQKKISKYVLKIIFNKFIYSFLLKNYNKYPDFIAFKFIQFMIFYRLLKGYNKNL